MIYLNKGLHNKEVESACIRFAGALYGHKNCQSLNELRSAKATGKYIQPKKLPPTQESFHLHVLRAAFQLHIWRDAPVGMIEQLGNVEDFGFMLENGVLRPKMMNQAMAPKELLNNIFCLCQPNSCHFDCACLENEQPCTEACGCKGILDGNDTCNNYYTSEANE